MLLVFASHRIASLGQESVTFRIFSQENPVVNKLMASPMFPSHVLVAPDMRDGITARTTDPKLLQGHNIVLSVGAVFFSCAK